MSQDCLQSIEQIKDIVVLKEITEEDQEKNYIMHNGVKVDELTKVFVLKQGRINIPLVIMMRLYIRKDLQATEQNYFGIAYQEEFEAKAISYYLEIVKHIMKQFPTTIEEDELILEQVLSSPYRQAVMYRLSNKKIIRQHIRYCQFILNILSQYQRVGNISQVLDEQISNFQEKGDLRLIVGVMEYFRYNKFK